jgi:multidrug efflux system outer membrane protein
MNRHHSATHPAASRALLLALAALAAPLAGCAVGPNYTPPADQTPQVWSGQLEGGLAAKPADLTRWWTLLNDPVLDSLVDRAVAGNKDLKLAGARLAEARAARGVAASELFPTVDAVGTADRVRNSAGGRGGPRAATGENDFYALGLDASWEIDLWGRIRRGVEAADAEIGSAEEARRDVLVTLLGEVAGNYVELRAFQARRLIAEANVRTQADSLELTRSRYAAGLTSELDVARAESNLRTTQSQVPSFLASEQRAAHRIAVLLGQAPGSLHSELAPPKPVPVVSNGTGEIPLGLPSELLRRRPDIRRAEREIAAATARVGVATADLFPRFSLTGSFGFENGEVAGMFDSPNRFWSFGPAMKWPVFEAGRIRSNIAVQEARTDQALASYEQTVLRALEEAENAISDYARERDRREALRKAVDATQRSVDLADALYRAQLTDFLSVLDAQRQLFQLQDQLAASDAIVTGSLVRLYKALGGGWETTTPTVASVQPAEPSTLTAPPAPAP